MKLLPYFIRKKFQQKPYLAKIINNIGWLFFDKIFRMGIGVFLGAWMARYLGPSQLGLLNYILAIMSFLMVIAGFGLNNIVVRDLVKETSQANQILGSACLIQIITASLAFSILVILSCWLFDSTNSQLICIVLGITLLFKPLDVIRFYFEANTLSKYMVWVENSSFIICSLLKIILILTHASLLAIAAVFLIDSIIISLLILLVYTYNNQTILSWQISLDRIKHDLKQCWPLILSGLTIIIYMQIDKIMLGRMLDYKAIGIYTAATKISEIWYFIPMVIMSSVNPSLIQAKTINEQNYYNKLAFIMKLLVLISTFIALITTFLSPYIIQLLYGNQYHSSTPVLTIHIWSGVFVSMGVAASQWFILENKQLLAFYRTLLGAIANILMNIILIPLYGEIGAAIATLIAICCASFLFDSFSRQTRQIFWLKLSTLNFVKTASLLRYNLKKI